MFWRKKHQHEWEEQSRTFLAGTNVATGGMTSEFQPTRDAHLKMCYGQTVVVETCKCGARREQSYLGKHGQEKRAPTADTELERLRKMTGL